MSSAAKSPAKLHVAVLGLNVGANIAALLAAAGYRTIGIDISTTAALRPKYDQSLAGWMLTNEGTIRRNLITSVQYADIKGVDYVFVCVNTDLKNYNLTIDSVVAAMKMAKEHAENSIAVVLSTLPFGGFRKILNQTGWPTHRAVYVPLMIAAGEFFDTFRKPSFLAIGCVPDAQEVAEGVKEFYSRWLKSMDGYVPAIHIVSPEEAELAKLFSNAFTSVKISMANMFGMLCERAGVDGNRVLQVVADNPTVGGKFFKPGYAFSGNCFPRDLEALITTLMDNNVTPGLLLQAQIFNRYRAFHPLHIMDSWDKRNVLMLGVSYKSGVADTRESAAHALFQEMRKSGISVAGFDPNIVGFDVKPNLDRIDTVIVTNKEPDYAPILGALGPDITVLDYTNSVTPRDRWKVWQAGKGWLGWL